MSEVTQPLVFGEPRAASVAEIEAELSALWREAAGDESHGAITRACALTLLVYVESEDAAREVSNLIGAVTAQDPCRVLVMVSEPAATPPGLTAWISAHCHLPTGGQKQVCCEQVTIAARGDSVRDLDNVVVPLTVPGLPVYLWWRAGRFAPAEYFKQILRVTHRVLIDSARFPESEADLANLSAEVQRLSSELTFADLNWTRMTPWRELIAQAFDTAESLDYLHRLKQVRIEYEQQSPRLGAQGAQALLLVGWLASRLKWQPEKRRLARAGQLLSFSFRSPHGPVEVERAARKFAGGGAGVCFSIWIHADGKSPATFTFLRGPDGKNAVTRRQMAGRLPVEGTARLEVLDEAELVKKEINFVGRDRIFEEALDMVAQMAALK